MLTQPRKTTKNQENPRKTKKNQEKTRKNSEKLSTYGMLTQLRTFFSSENSSSTPSCLDFLNAFS